jgi:ATP-dependent Clp protease ATP-binding subunit ClpX
MQSQSIGFKSNSQTNDIDKENYLQYISPLDIRRFGLIPELIGRMPVLVHLNPLDRKALRSILTEPKNALIKQYRKLFALENIKLEFDEGALNFIVEKAFEFKLGARGLRSICETIMTDLMFDLPSDHSIKSFTMTEEYCKTKLNKEKLNQLKAA